jgi:hypothetical protein
MRRLIADMYKIVFKLTGHRAFSFFFALGYITTLNLLSVYGICILLETLYPQLWYIHNYLFTLRLNFFATVAVVSTLNFRMMLPLHNLSNEMNVKPKLLPIIIYTFLSLVLFIYILITNLEVDINAV